MGLFPKRRWRRRGRGIIIIIINSLFVMMCNIRNTKYGASNKTKELDKNHIVLHQLSFYNISRFQIKTDESAIWIWYNKTRNDKWTTYFNEIISILIIRFTVTGETKQTYLMYYSVPWGWELKCGLIKTGKFILYSVTTGWFNFN